MSVDVDLEPSLIALNLNYMHEYDGSVRLCVIFELGRVSIVCSREGPLCRLNSSSNLYAGLRRSNVAFECFYSLLVRNSLN